MFFILIQLYAILICHYWIVVIFFSSNLIKLNYLFCIFYKVCGNFDHYEKKKKNKKLNNENCYQAIWTQEFLSQLEYAEQPREQSPPLLLLPEH